MKNISNFLAQGYAFLTVMELLHSEFYPIAFSSLTAYLANSALSPTSPSFAAAVPGRVSKRALSIASFPLSKVAVVFLRKSRPSSAETVPARSQAGHIPHSQPTCWLLLITPSPASNVTTLLRWLICSTLAFYCLNFLIYFIFSTSPNASADSASSCPHLHCSYFIFPLLPICLVAAGVYTSFCRCKAIYL